MSYEVTYVYFEKNKEGIGYDTTNPKEIKKQVGEPFEDISLADLAQNIFNQLSRRDILMQVSKISELVKKEISFKETSGGVIIKHKKFILDGTKVIMQEVAQEVPAQLPVQIATQGATHLPAVSPETMAAALVQKANPGRPIKYVVLDPDIPNIDKVQKMKLAFTPERRYPVFGQAPHPTETGVMVYTMWDDHKREISIKDIYFVNADQNLMNGFNDSVDRNAHTPRLAYENFENAPMPDIRRR